MKHSVLLPIVLGILVTASQAFALQIMGTANGEWNGVRSINKYDFFSVHNWDLGGDAVFQWGTPGDSQSMDNRLEFDGAGSNGEGEWDVQPGMPFQIGELFYQNGRTYNSIGIVGADLVVTFDMLNHIRISQTIHFSIENTPNTTGNAESDGDYVIIDNPFSETAFQWNNELYFLELLGFSQDQGRTLTDQFISPENSTASAGLFARIIQDDSQPIPQPEPGAFIMLFVGIGGFFVVRKRGGFGGIRGNR